MDSGSPFVAVVSFELSSIWKHLNSQGIAHTHFDKEALLRKVIEKVGKNEKKILGVVRQKIPNKKKDVFSTYRLGS